MNSRHTIALGLLSWYLMMPPTAYETGEPRVISDAPLNKWKILGTFDSPIECQRARMAGREKAKAARELYPWWPGSYHAAFVKSWLGALCVSSDNPQLNEK